MRQITTLDSFRTDNFPITSPPMAKMEVLSLFAGLDGQGAAFRDRGHDVVSYEMDPKFKPDVVADIFKVDSLPKVDMILVGFPCEKFSVASFGKNWTGGWRAYKPKTEGAKLALRLLEHTKGLVKAAGAKFDVWENPWGLFRKFVPELACVTLWYCQYWHRNPFNGNLIAKATDVFGHFPPSWKPRPICHNGNTDHEEARRGAKTGTQGLKDRADRGKWPYALSLDLCLAAERDLGLK